MFRPSLAGRIALGTVILLITLAGDAQARDPWYSDVYSHWAQPFIRVLWEEDVVDGTLSTWWGNEYAYFFPEGRGTRAEFAMMAAKVFRLQPLPLADPAFIDVPSDFRLYGGAKEAFLYIQAAWKHGLVNGVAERQFMPYQVITREQGVAILIRGLGLGPYSHTLTEEEIARQFSRFWDGGNMDPSLRKELAVAIKLQILRGYPNGSLNLKRPLTRAEAATFIYRSCLIIPEAGPNPFSPDGDGVDDTTSFRLLTLKNRNTERWELSITDYAGSHSFKVLSGSGQPPAAIPWDGTDSRGVPLPEGIYFYRARVWDRYSQEFSSVQKPVTLERRSLTAQLYPDLLPPGGTLELSAQTTGSAGYVSAIFPAGDSVDLLPTSPPSYSVNLWRASHQVPVDTPDGTYKVTFRAGYNGTSREIPVAYRVVEPLSINGDVSPNPAKAGQQVTIRAYTTHNIGRVSGRLPGGYVSEFRRLQPGSWEAAYVLPPDLPDGAYSIELKGYTARKEASTTLSLIIRGSLLGEVDIFLSD